MEFPLNHEVLNSLQISVRTAGFFSGPKLLRHGDVVEGKKSQYALYDAHGNDVSIALKHNFLDPVPKVEVNGEIVELARPLAWYEYVWMSLPILLAIAGGAIGALIGFSAATASSHVFRSQRGPIAKYLITATMSVVAVIAYLLLATIIQLLIE